jgi:hypothetical protein
LLEEALSLQRLLVEIEDLFAPERLWLLKDAPGRLVCKEIAL